jgi:general stress protein YciG
VRLDQRDAQQIVGVEVVRRGLEDLVQRIDRLAKLAGFLQRARVVEAAFERALTGAEAEAEQDERESGGEQTRPAGEPTRRREIERKGTVHACRSLPQRTGTIRNHPGRLVDRPQQLWRADATRWCPRSPRNSSPTSLRDFAGRRVGRNV